MEMEKKRETPISNFENQARMAIPEVREKR
jgi:hypothetical protein